MQNIAANNHNAPAAVPIPARIRLVTDAQDNVEVPDPNYYDYNGPRLVVHFVRKYGYLSVLVVTGFFLVLWVVTDSSFEEIVGSLFSLLAIVCFVAWIWDSRLYYICWTAQANSRVPVSTLIVVLRDNVFNRLLSAMRGFFTRPELNGGGECHLDL